MFLIIAMKRDTSYEGLTGKWQQYQVLRAGDIPRGQSSKPLVPNLFGIVCLYSQEMCNCNALSHIVYLWAIVPFTLSFQSFLESQGGKTLRIGPIGPHLDPDWNTWTIIKWIALKLVQIFMDLREWILITLVSPLLIVKYLYLLHGLVQNSIQSFTVVRTYMTLVSLIFVVLSELLDWQKKLVSEWSEVTWPYAQLIFAGAPLADLWVEVYDRLSLTFLNSILLHSDNMLFVTCFMMTLMKATSWNAFD